MLDFFLPRWIYIFFALLIAIAIIILILGIIYSFCSMDWDSFFNWELIKTLNPLAHTWSRLLLIGWFFLSAWIADASN
jgi:hypothetical protein